MTRRLSLTAIRPVLLIAALAVLASVAPTAVADRSGATAEQPLAALVRPPTTVASAAVSRTITRRATLGSLRAASRARARQKPAARPQDARQAEVASLRARRGFARLTGRSLSPRPDADGRRAPAPSASQPAPAPSQRQPRPAPLPVPEVASTRVTGSTPGLRTSFEGLNLYQERYVANHGNQFTLEPPDQGMCVGRGLVLETVNGVLRVFTTVGRPKSAPLDLNTFYGYPAMIDREAGVVGPQLSDPSCLYDAVNHRWIHIVLTMEANPETGEPTLDNHLDIAVSLTADPLGGWTFFSVNTTDDGRKGTPVHRDCPCIGDYPHVAADRNGIYITTNEYPTGDGAGIFGTHFNGAQLYAFSRKQLTSGHRRVRVTQLSHLQLAGAAGPVPAFSLIGANAPAGVFSDTDGGSEYFLSTTAAAETGNAVGRSNTIALWTLSNTRSLDSRHLALELVARPVRSEVYGVPPLSEQKVGDVPLRDCLMVACVEGEGPATEVEGPINSSDTRIFNTWFAHGRIWGSLSTIVRVAGHIQAGAAWFKLTPSGTMARQGYVANAHNNVIYPAIATLANGKGAMALNLVGRDWYPTAAYARVSASGPHDIHVAAAGAAPQDGLCEYAFENCGETEVPSSRPSWGDYAAAQTYGQSVWLGSEYIASTCTFDQFVADFTCGNRRGLLGNWSTRLTRIRP